MKKAENLTKTAQRLKPDFLALLQRARGEKPETKSEGDQAKKDQ